MDLNILIYGIPLDAISTDHAELDTEIKQHFKDSHKIDLTLAKFLKADPKSQEGKRATSIMIRLPEADVAKVIPQVVFMRKIKESHVIRGHRRLIPSCCNMTSAKSPTCNGAHSAKDEDCLVQIQVKEQERERPEIFDWRICRGRLVSIK
ncbi:hypothetical protein HOY80DRAFT_1044989 [Tuber brumale]|nr:hypothetical protein HOY80DRAFT_1044989 [Tuber brumale]